VAHLHHVLKGKRKVEIQEGGVYCPGVGCTCGAFLYIGLPESQAPAELQDRTGSSLWLCVLEEGDPIGEQLDASKRYPWPLDMVTSCVKLKQFLLLTSLLYVKLLFWQGSLLK
jgi:hypothetical protein